MTEDVDREPRDAKPPDQDITVTSEDRTIGMLCHLLGLLTGFLGPLIIWLIKKDQSLFINDQGKEALNFQLTLLIAYAIGVITACFVVGIFLILATWIFAIVVGIMGAVNANKGQRYRYPLTIRMIS